MNFRTRVQFPLHQPNNNANFDTKLALFLFPEKPYFMGFFRLFTLQYLDLMPSQACFAAVFLRFPEENEANPKK